jgi:hypothetical protein
VRAAWWVQAGAALGITSACTAPPAPPPAAPQVEVGVAVYYGDPLHGVRATLPERASDAASATAPALDVAVAAQWVSGPALAWAGLAEVARTVVALRTSSLLAVDLGALARVRFAREPSNARGDGGRDAFALRGPVATQALDLAPGSTGAFTVTDGGPPAFAVHVSYPHAGPPQVFLVTPAQLARSECCALLDPALVHAGTSFCLLDAPSADGPGLLWRVSLQWGSQPAAREQPPQEQPDDVVGATRALTLQHQAVAVAALSVSWSRRRALVQLAHTHGARLTGDVALLAEPALLAPIAAEVSSGLGKGNAAPELGWLLEAATVCALADGVQQQGLTPETMSAARRHLGITLAAAGALREAARRSATQTEFAAWLRAEHELALEDARPAQRVAGYDWLAARDCAPAAYDPLADKRARRAALAAHRAERER